MSLPLPDGASNDLCLLKRCLDFSDEIVAEVNAVPRPAVLFQASSHASVQGQQRVH